MPMRYRQWVRQLKSGSLPRAVYLCGPETWLRDQALVDLKERLFGDADSRHLGHDRFYGGEGPLSQVTSALASVGLFTPVRLVTLSNPEKAWRAPAAERRELVELLRQGLPGSYFVAFSEAFSWQLEKKNDLARSLLSACLVVDLEHPNPGEAMQWLLEECRRRRIGLEPQAAASLVSRIGTDLQELSRELEKLSLWCEPGVRVGVERMKEIVRGGEIGDVAVFCQAVLDGAVPEALSQYSALRRTEAVPAMLWRLQRLARERILRERGTGQETALPKLLRLVYQVEWGVKSGTVPSGQDEGALEIAIAEMARFRPDSRTGRRESET
jgi:DNA polymerase-3 subunit delta